METLIQENKNLRLHIEACYLKVAKARKVIIFTLLNCLEH